MGEAQLGGASRLAARRDEIVPLTADLRRVHFNVGTQVVRKLEAAREGLSHAVRGATMEHVLEAALDLLLEKQAKARGQVKKPRTVVQAKPPTLTTATPESEVTQHAQTLDSSVARPEGRAIRRTGPRETIPAAVKRAVWLRDQGRCTWPLDSGGVCGSTHRLELDHIHPWARDGEPTFANLRVVCGAHNTLAARQAFGARCVERYSPSSPAAAAGGCGRAAPRRATGQRR
jgi:hypothetical protein